MNTDTRVPGARGDAGLTPRVALRIAWAAWVVLLLLPYAILPFALHETVSAPASRSNPRVASAWFLGIMLCLFLALLFAVVWRIPKLRSYWLGDPVRPRRYLCGMATLWGALMICGVVAELVCASTATFVPNVLPAAVALLAYVILRPEGSVMTAPVEASDEPSNAATRHG
jgi:hypothetical protein